MTVAIVMDDQWEVRRCVAWGEQFARAANEPLMLVVLEQTSDATRVEKLAEQEGGKPSLVAAAAIDAVKQRPSLQVVVKDERQERLQADGSNNDNVNPDDDRSESTPAPHPVVIVRMTTAETTEALLQLVRDESISLLILPRHRTSRGLDPETPWEHAVYRRASCATLLLCPAEMESSGEISVSADETESGNGGVLSPTDEGRTAVGSLRFARKIATQLDAPLTALYVEAEVGEMARDVGRRIIDRVVRRSLGSKQDARRDVVVAANVREAIHKYAEQGDFSLIVIGANRIGVGRRWLKSSISEWLMAQSTKAAVAVLRPPLPLAHRFTTQLADWVRQRVPQLDREARISLFERVQSSSRWDFDFIALICLSTIIAALGLIQNSPAVVIGAMLVAPLMTPLVGSGLAIMQGNRVLLLGAGGTVLRGFLLAFFIGYLVGWCVPGLIESREMLARGSPSVLDLGVALIGGVAASYALGRPNLFSALPGVAIAAALVPPIATAGLAASLSNWALTFGALLLFATNIVAIVLGTSIALFAVGVRPAHEHGVVESWVYRIAATLIALASVIAAYEFVPHHALPSTLHAQLATTLDNDADARLVEARSVSHDHVLLIVHSPQPLTEATRTRLAASTRVALKKPIRLEIETRLVTVDEPK